MQKNISKANVKLDKDIPIVNQNLNKILCEINCKKQQKNSQYHYQIFVRKLAKNLKSCYLRR